MEYHFIFFLKLSLDVVARGGVTVLERAPTFSVKIKHTDNFC